MQVDKNPNKRYGTAALATTSGPKSERSFVPTSRMTISGAKMPNHVEVIETKLLNGTTANAEQMRRSSALEVEIAIRTSVETSF